MSSPLRVRFGQVWESRHEAIGTMRYLVVSSDAYNEAFGDRRVIAVEVDSASIYQGSIGSRWSTPAPRTSTA